MSGVKNEAAFFRKIPIFGKKPENSSEIMFFFFLPKIKSLFPFLPKKNGATQYVLQSSESIMSEKDLFF